MQYDLFHAYTVDAHTLFVVSNLRRLAIPKFNHEFPALSQIMQSLPRQELAYLAALFHDIAKGRGGDHSEFGAVDAEAFCLEQGLGRYEARLVAWLVRNHLILSITSQKKDISDPEVIHAFAKAVGDQAHLDYLYVLTVRGRARHQPQALEHVEGAAVRGVLRAHQAGAAPGAGDSGRSGGTDPGNAGARPRADAVDTAGGHRGRVVPVDRRLFPAGTRPKRSRGKPPRWPGAIRGTTRRSSRSPADRARRHGGAHLYPHRLHSFARTTAVLDQMGLNVVDARLITSANGFSLETYVVLEDNGAVIAEPERISEIERGLWRNLQQPEDSPLT